MSATRMMRCWLLTLALCSSFLISSRGFSFRRRRNSSIGRRSFPSNSRVFGWGGSGSGSGGQEQDWYDRHYANHFGTDSSVVADEVEEASRGVKSLMGLIRGAAMPRQSDVEASPRIWATGINLTETDQSNPFRTAWTRQLSEQSIINNIPKEWLNAFTRTIGWLALDVIAYGGNAMVKAFQDP